MLMEHAKAKAANAEKKCRDSTIAAATTET